MKKWVTFLIILCVLAIAIVWVYRFYFPQVVAEALVSEDSIAALPEQVQEQVKAIKSEVDKQMEKVPELMEEAELEYNDLVVIIEEIDSDQLLNALEELKSKNWQTTDEVFDIGLKHVSLKGYDLEKFRSSFNEAISEEQIEEVLNALGESQLLTSMSIQVMKEAARKLIEAKKEEIEEKLNQ